MRQEHATPFDTTSIARGIAWPRMTVLATPPLLAALVDVERLALGAAERAQPLYAAVCPHERGVSAAVHVAPTICPEPLMSARSASSSGAH